MRIVLFGLIVLWIAGASPALGETFDHAEHNVYAENPDCTLCHREDANSITPEMKVCLDCHEQEFIDTVELPALKSHGPLWAFNHRLAAKSDAQNCSSCHQQSMCLECHKAGFADEQGEFSNSLANVHRSDFHVSHPIAARTDPQLCTSCHENDYCVDCHNAFAPADLAVQSHRRGFRDGTLNPLHEGYSDFQCAGCHPSGSVLPSSSGWSHTHAREARKNLATCQACHPEGDICLRCHSARNGLMINPHPKDWGDISGTLRRASDARTCRKCH